ncbi:uncharacterized protein LOC116351262 [Contarinia nasturtii]|uniref:uncharacterized protein LOC116351262 n=1 Tax=Contarinia nasturtii TaxID=265458 RepID=UPI0012D434F6|nr:uncharacterized protein LOC116351262 [Contarinia nasturtii]
MFAKLLGRTALISAAPVATAMKSNESEPQAVYKPQELPIYTTVFGKDAKKVTTVENEPSVMRSSIEGGVKIVRECCCDCVKAVKDKKRPIDEFIGTGIEHSQFAFDYLNQPANGIHRTGAIAVGAVSGYIIAIRRGFFRRLLYTSFGGLSVASICYPKEAELYWQQALSETKTYATILYNFAYGVKPGDEPKPLPNIVPENLKEAYRNLKGFFVSNK